MSGSHASGKPIEETAEEKFLAAEYQALISLDTARNQRLDGLITLYLTVAAAPWALLSFLLKDHPELPTISTIPPLVAWTFILTGLLGALVAMIRIQVGFNIGLYMRNVNAIRGYFLEKDTKLSFHLPTSSKVPPYYSKWEDRHLALIGTAFVNSLYIALGLFNVIGGQQRLSLRVAVAALVAILSFAAHLIYYRTQAQTRESRSTGKHLSFSGK
jgi:hypothetical protein